MFDHGIHGQTLVKLQEILALNFANVVFFRVNHQIIYMCC